MKPLNCNYISMNIILAICELKCKKYRALLDKGLITVSEYKLLVANVDKS